MKPSLQSLAYVSDVKCPINVGLGFGKRRMNVALNRVSNSVEQQPFCFFSTHAGTLRGSFSRNYYVFILVTYGRCQDWHERFHYLIPVSWTSRVYSESYSSVCAATIKSRQ